MTVGEGGSCGGRAGEDRDHRRWISGSVGPMTGWCRARWRSGRRPHPRATGPNGHRVHRRGAGWTSSGCDGSISPCDPIGGRQSKMRSAGPPDDVAVRHESERRICDILPHAAGGTSAVAARSVVRRPRRRLLTIGRPAQGSSFSSARARPQSRPICATSVLDRVELQLAAQPLDEPHPAVLVVEVAVEVEEVGLEQRGIGLLVERRAAGRARWRPGRPTPSARSYQPA